MKKFLTLSMAGLMVLSSAAVAFGAELSSSIGGRFYGYASSIDGDHGFNPAPGNDCWDTILGATVKGNNGTWARISFIASTWEQTVNHAFGIDNIAGTPWSLGFDTHDTGTTNLGQQFMGDLFNDFKADPLFNSCNMAGSFNYKYVTDKFEYRGEAKVWDGDGSTGVADTGVGEIYANTFIFKTDAGKFYIGDQHYAGGKNDMMIVGYDGKISDLGVKVDFWSDKDNARGGGEFGNCFWGGGGHQTLQATVTLNKLTGQFLYSMPDADFKDVIGLGLAYKVTDALTLGAKTFMVDDTILENHNITGYEYTAATTTDKEKWTTNYGTESTSNYYDVYAIYNVGAWDLKAGVSNAQYMYGQGGKYNAGARSSDKGVANYDTGAHYSDDPFFYVGVHFEF